MAINLQRAVVPNWMALLEHFTAVFLWQLFLMNLNSVCKFNKFYEAFHGATPKRIVEKIFWGLFYTKIFSCNSSFDLFSFLYPAH
jgi:hypothetical protein